MVKPSTSPVLLLAVLKFRNWPLECYLREQCLREGLAQKLGREAVDL